MSLDNIIFGHPLYINIALQYVRARQATYVRDTLQGIVRELIETDDLDLEADPSIVRMPFIKHVYPTLKPSRYIVLVLK